MADRAAKANPYCSRLRKIKDLLAQLRRSGSSAADVADDESAALSMSRKSMHELLRELDKLNLCEVEQGSAKFGARRHTVTPHREATSEQRLGGVANATVWIDPKEATVRSGRPPMPRQYDPKQWPMIHSGGSMEMTATQQFTRVQSERSSTNTAGLEPMEAYVRLGAGKDSAFPASHACEDASAASSISVLAKSRDDDYDWSLPQLEIPKEFYKKSGLKRRTQEKKLS